MNLSLRKSRFRITITAGLLALFAFTSLFTIYQDGKDLTAAYASSSGNNTVGWLECVSTIAACAGAIGKGVVKCIKHGWLSTKCAQAAGAAAVVCADAITDCNYTPNYPQVWVNNGWV